MRALVLCALATACAKPPAPDAPLELLRDGKPVTTLTRAALGAKVPPVQLEVFDPYYARIKRFRAFPLAPMLELGFAAPRAELAKQEWILKAKDGYAVPISGERLFEEGAHVAFEDLDHPAWEPIGPQRANPGPYYLVWSKDSQRDTEAHPRPWQLASIEIAAFESIYPHTIPKGGDEAALRGFAIFKAQCIRCHRMNHEGGKVGPELNVPKNVLEYRDRAYLSSFIKDPWQYRYGAMPPMKHLTDADIEDVLAYFELMKGQKHDPERR